MKLLPTIAEPKASGTRRAGDPANGRAASGEDRPGFGDVLADLGAKATATDGVSGAASPTLRDGVTKLAVAAAQTADAAADSAPGLLEKLKAGASRGVPDIADLQSRFARDGAVQDDSRTVGKLLKRVGKGDDDVSAAEPAGSSHETAIVQCLAVPLAGAQKMSGPVASEPMPSAAMPNDSSTKVQATGLQAAEKAAAMPLVYDVSVASNPAPISSSHAASSTADATADRPDALRDTTILSPGPKPQSAGSPPMAGDQTPAAATPPPQNPAPAQARGPAARSDESAGIAEEAVMGRADGHATAAALSAKTTDLPDEPPHTLSGRDALVAVPPVTASARDGAAADTDRGGGRSPLALQSKARPEPATGESAACRKDETEAGGGGAISVGAQTPTNALPTLSPPVRQVAEALARLATDSAAPSTATQIPDVVTSRPTLARTLTLQMSPAALGEVSIKMHATGGALDVQLTASDPQTAALLVREHDALAASLQDGHTTLHSLVIQDGSGVPQPGGHHATQQDASGTGSRAHRQGSETGADGESRQRRERPDSQARRDAPTGGGRGRPQVSPGGAVRRSLLV